jgi:hypothetical protein
MTNLIFAVVGARAERYAAVPTLAFRLRITEAGGQEIHTIALRCQIHIAPQRRRYAGGEQERLWELFGEPARWSDTLRPLLWAHTSVLAPGFQGSTEVDMPLACTYDFEVTAAKYFHALEDGEIPLVFLFSGSAFIKEAHGFRVEPVPWEKQAAYRLPVPVWRGLMDQYFPGSAWIRLQRPCFDALHHFKGRRALPSWDAAIEALLQEAGQGNRA